MSARNKKSRKSTGLNKNAKRILWCLSFAILTDPSHFLGYAICEVKIKSHISSSAIEGSYGIAITPAKDNGRDQILRELTFKDINSSANSIEPYDFIH
jgi:hypothetical protein